MWQGSADEASAVSDVFVIGLRNQPIVRLAALVYGLIELPRSAKMPDNAATNKKCNFAICTFRPNVNHLVFPHFPAVFLVICPHYLPRRLPSCGRMDGPQSS